MREINLPALNAEQRQHAARILCEIGGTEWVTAIERVKKLPGTVYRSVDWERVERIGIALTQAGMTPEVRDSTLNATPLREQRFQAEESPARRDVNREAQMSVYKVTGVGEDLEVFEDKLTIGPRGVLGFMSKGLKGTKTIPFRSITAVQHRKAGAILSGYLQFTIPGGIESRGALFSAASDENTLMYTGVDKNDLVEEVKAYVERRIRELRDEDRGGPGTRSAGSTADELTKLAKLRDQGVLTEEEFAKAKQRLL